MDLRSCYPVLCCSDLAHAHAFWTTWFGFDTTFAADWYVSLRHDRTGQELAMLAYAHPTVPEGFRRPSAGVLVNLEVADVDAEWERLVVRGGLPPALQLRSEEFGQRHFIVPAHDGVLVDVITEIPPAPEYAASFVPAAGSS